MTEGARTYEVAWGFRYHARPDREFRGARTNRTMTNVRRTSSTTAWLAVIISTRLLAFVCLAENWTEFRGPTGQGNSLERGLPLTWSETENVVWKVPIPGKGWSSPVVVNDQIWLTTASDNGRSLRALCLDRHTGRLVNNVEVFRLADPGPIHRKNSHASPTPILEGDRVYLHFGSHGTACITGSGQIVWKTQELKYYHRHGPGGSPVVYGNLLIVSCDGYDIQYVVALDKRTGKIRWKSPRKCYQAYTTPLTIQVQGKDQLISPGAHRAVAYEPLTGKEIWSVRYGEGYSNVPRPVYGHGLVFICSGFDQAVLLAVRPDGQGDVTESHVAWRLKRAVPLTPSPLLVGDELYLVSDNGIASCLDAETGKIHWQQRLGGNHSASPGFADGRIYFLSEEGETTVIAPGKAFKKLASNQLNGQTLASMAVSGRQSTSAAPATSTGSTSSPVGPRPSMPHSRNTCAKGAFYSQFLLRQQACRPVIHGTSDVSELDSQK